MSKRELRIDQSCWQVLDPRTDVTKDNSDQQKKEVVKWPYRGVGHDEILDRNGAIWSVRAYLGSKSVGASTDTGIPQFLDLGAKRIAEVCRLIATANYGKSAIPQSEFHTAADNKHYTDGSITVSQATSAMTIQTLLLQKARHRGIKGRLDTALESENEAVMRALIDVDVPRVGPGEATCRTFYSSNSNQFRNRDSFKASQILVAAHPGNKLSWDGAICRAEMLIGELVKAPERFELLARRWSDCDSKKNGGDLGTIVQGQMPREVEIFLYGAMEGQISPVPIKSGVGYHVIRLDKRNIGDILPYESVRPLISRLLTEWAWCRNLSAYLDQVANDAVM